MIDQQTAQNLFEYKDGNLHWRKTNAVAGYVCGRGYRRIKLRQKNYLAHRLVYLLHYGHIPEFIDHIDGNKENNKIENLREATRSENGFNRNTYANNKSGVKNVIWLERLKKWTVKLTVNKKRLHFGLFEDLELADLVSIEARNKYHGAFANHFIKGN